MSRGKTFFWYDLETFGLDPKYDRIAQFAGVRTTMDLEIIEEPTVLYCRTSDDYLPDPIACLVTKLTPQSTSESGLCESDFIGRINELFSIPGTCGAGFNSIKFDDEFIRNALFRNLIDPYKREYAQGNSRWDIIDLVRAAHDVRPEGILWPRNEETGKPSFKLSDLLRSNNLENENPHEALNDVYGTIEIARLVLKHQPKLFDYYLKLRDKAKVKSMLRTPLGEPVLHTCAYYTSEWGCSTLVMPLTVTESNADSIIAFDLSKDPRELIDWCNSFNEAQQASAIIEEIDTFLTANQQSEDPKLEKTCEMLKRSRTTIEDLSKAFGTAKRSVFTIEGIVRIASNRVPFISPLNVLEDDLAKRLGIDKKLCLERYQKLKDDPMVAVRVRSDAEINRYSEPLDIDGSLYSGLFIGNADLKKFSTIRATRPHELWKATFTFDDHRAHEMLWRFICRNWPESLDAHPEEKERWKSFCAWRLLNPPVNQLRSLEKYQNIIAGKLADLSVSPTDKEILSALEQWGNQLKRRVGLDT